MAHDVFISYSSEDKPTADAICSTLEAEGIRCWIAPRDIMAGSPYGGSIVEAINKSRAFILVFSSNSNKSNHVMSEVERAFSQEITIIPFRIEDVQPSEDTALYLSAPHWLDALTPPLESHLSRLAETVKRLLKDEPPPPLPPPPPPPPAPFPWKPVLLKIAAGLTLTIVIFALWFFDPLKIRTRPVKPVETSNYEQLFNQGIVKLGPSSNLMERLDGIELLARVSASGDEQWYWKVMDRLTRYVRDNARWNGDASPNKMAQDILKMLEVIAAQPPVYPVDANEEYKRNKKRNLQSTDLRGLRLIGGAHLEYVDFQDAHLDAAVLTGANLEGSILYKASLVDVKLNKANMKDVDIRNADINRADFMQTEGLYSDDILLSDNWQCANLPVELYKEALADAGEEAGKTRCQ
jgi:hypothetical protein